jgi:hypothetical protein
MSPAPEPPSSVENANWLAAVDWVVSSLDTNAVIGTFTVWLLMVNGMPELLFAVWQLFALSGKGDDPPGRFGAPLVADVVRPVR